MPDPSTTPAFTPPDPNALAERQKRMDALLKQTMAAPAPASAGAAAAAPTAQPATTQPSLQVPAQAVSAQATPAPAAPAAPAGPVQADRSLGEMMVRERVPQVQAIPTQQPATFDPLGVKAAQQEAVDRLARQGVAPSRFASETVRIGMEQAAQAQAGLNKRVDDYLRTRGYDEPVSLVGDKIDLPGTVQRMEASALTKKAQEAGYPDWFAVPPGPEADQIRQQVQEKVASDLRHAAAVGKGAIFIDPNPARTEEWLSKLPVTWAVTAAALLPHAQATMTPTGAQLKTESPVMSALRPVGAPVTVWASMRKAAADSGFIDKVGEAREISAREFEAYAQGNTELGDQLHQEWSEKRSEAINDAVAAATGGKDWKDIFLDVVGMPGGGQDPEAVKSLVQVVRTDPMSMQVNDELADDIERVFKPSPFVMDAIRGTLWLEGAAEDFGGPDLLTPALAGAGAAVRWGARLEGSATDLTRGAAAIRDAANAGADVRAVIEAADGAYQGMGEALKLRIAARARVQPSVVAQVRNLETHAKEMAAKVTAAEQRLADAREATDVAAAGRDLAQTRLDAARAQTELATAYRSFTQEQLDVWNAYGADSIKHAEALMEEVERLRGPANRDWAFTDESGAALPVTGPRTAGTLGQIGAAELELRTLAKNNAPRVAEINAANDEIRSWGQLVSDAESEVESAKAALADSKRLRAADQQGGKLVQEEARAGSAKNLEQLQAEHKALVAEVDGVVAMSVAKRDEVLKEANDAVAKANERLKAARAAKQDKASIERLKAEVEAAKQDVARLRAQYDADVAEARALAEKTRKGGFQAMINARGAMKKKPPGTTYTDIETEWAEEIAFREAELKRARDQLKEAKAQLKAAGETQARLMTDYGPFIQEQMTLTDRVARLHARAAQLETEAGWRVLSVADDGRAADAALENGHGLLRDAGLMPDINPLDAKSTREMIERGKLRGEKLKEANEEAGRRLGAAMQDYRRANTMLRGASRETQEAAEAALNRLRKLGETQYGRELAEGRARAWREEALAMADDIDRGVVELKKRPKDTSERAVNILDGAIVDTAKDGTRTLDTAAFRAKMEEQFTRDGVAWWLRHAGDDATLWRQALGFEPKGDWNWQGSQEALETELDLALQARPRGYDPIEARERLVARLDYWSLAMAETPPSSQAYQHVISEMNKADSALFDFDALAGRGANPVESRINRAILALDNVRKKPPPTIKLSPGEALALQQGQRGLLEGLRRTSGDAAAVNQVEALLALRRDPLNIGASFMDTTPRKFVQGIADQYEHWKRMLDPMVAKVGDADESVIRVSKMAAQRAAIMRDELLMIGRLARAPMGWRGFVRSTKNWGGSKEIIAALTRYMDSTEAMEVFGRATIGNRGPETVWSKARRQILNSSSLDEASHDAAYRAVETGANTEGDIANKPLLGLSRMWWPPGEQMNARASAALWGAAIDELRRHDTFQGFMDAMRARTSGVTGGPVEYIPDRAYGFGARNASQAAVQADVGDMMVREIGGIINAEEAADFNRIITGNADQTVSMSRAWETAARLGSPITQTATRDSARAVAQQQEIVRLATTRSGEDVFALTTQVRALDDTLDKVVKETFARNAASRNIGETSLVKHALDMQQWWKSSVTIGLIVPNPRYFINNLFGNISQVWLTQGLGTSARMTFQNAPSVIPVVGRYFDAAMRATSEAASDVPVLGSMLNALINPHLNKFMAGQQGTFQAANGIVYDLDTVRQWAADDGVLTSFMQEEYGRLFARSRGNSTLTRFRYLQDDLYAWANEIEIRQRTALYLDLLRQGYTRSAARERTLRALYDWHGALTPFESSYITTLVPFYRFIKLGFKQAWYEAISKPLLKPGEATVEALRGSSGLARMRNQGMLLRLPELQDDGQYQDEADKFDAMAQYRNLDYLNKRISWTERNDPNQIAMYQGGRGQFMPYSTIALPALTAIDMGNLVTLTMYALPAGAMSVGGALGLTDERWTSPDVMQPYWDEASNLAGPIAAPFIATAAQKAGYDSPTQQEIVRLKPGEAAMAQFFGWAVGLGAEKALDYNEHQRRALQDKLDPTQVGKDYQSTVASAGTAALVRGFPGVMQAPQWLDAFVYENPAAKELLKDGPMPPELLDYLTWGSGQVTNFMRSFPNDPNNNLTQRQSKFAEELKGRADYQEGEEREKQSTTP